MEGRVEVCVVGARILRARTVLVRYYVTVPWLFFIIGWIYGAAAMPVKKGSIYEDPTVVGVLAGVWLALAGGLVLVPAVRASIATADRKVARTALALKAITILLLLSGAYLALFLSTFTGGTLHTASGKYLLPGPFIALIGFCVGWMVLEVVATEQRR